MTLRRAHSLSTDAVDKDVEQSWIEGANHGPHWLRNRSARFSSRQARVSKISALKEFLQKWSGHFPVISLLRCNKEGLVNNPPAWQPPAARTRFEQPNPEG